MVERRIPRVHQRTSRKFHFRSSSKNVRLWAFPYNQCKCIDNSWFWRTQRKWPLCNHARRSHHIICIRRMFTKHCCVCVLITDYMISEDGGRGTILRGEEMDGCLESVSFYAILCLVVFAKTHGSERRRLERCYRNHLVLYYCSLRWLLVQNNLKQQNVRIKYEWSREGSIGETYGGGSDAEWNSYQ